MSGVSVGSCRCKHFLLPQSYDKEEVRCYMSIIFIIAIVVLPLTMIILAACYKIKSRARSKVDVTFDINNQVIHNNNL